METLYMCEYCRKTFSNKEICKEHEEKHIKVENLAIASADYSEDPEEFPTNIYIDHTIDGPLVRYVKASEIIRGEAK